MNLTKTLVEQASKHGTPVYSATGQFIKGWQYEGKYIPNPDFTPDNVFAIRLKMLEMVNSYLKQGYILDKEHSFIAPNGKIAILRLKRGSDTKSFQLNTDQYEEIVSHLTKATITI